MSISIVVLSVLVASISAKEEGAGNLRRRDYELPFELPAEEPTRRVFVKYRHDRRSAFETELAKRSSKTKMHYDFRDMDTFVLTLTEGDLKDLKKNPDVESIHDDVERYPQYIPGSIKRRHLQGSEEVPYGVDLVQARDAWGVGARGQGVKVCVIDTGVDETHEDLPLLSGLESSSLPYGKDGVGHGTHCSGTIAAAANGIGVVGVAPEAEIFSVKVFADNGMFAYSSGILSAAMACAENGADIISMSLGGPLPSPFELFGFRQLLNSNGIISVAAAGNSGNGLWSFPASYPGVISVAAVDENKEKAPFSQFNRQVDVAAPGVDVLSTFPMKAPCLICDKLEEYGYGTISGTSMATPHVAGVLALLKSFKPDATPEELVGALQNSAEDLGGSGKDRQFGHGLVQAFSAIEYLSGGANASSFSQPTYARTECGEDEVLFDMKLFTDGYSEETYWELRRITDGGVHLSGAGYDDNAAISVEKCIPRNCYTFTMFDSQGDGICCSHGKGSYSLSVGGEAYVINGGDFKSEDIVTFGECREDTATDAKSGK